MMVRILVINGPNLDILGKREADIYGNVTMDEINEELERLSAVKGNSIEFFQSNHEGDIVEKITHTEADGMLINPAAYTHTSVAIRDALSSLDIPVVEVHLSNIYAREEFRHKSLIAPVVTGQISGLGKRGYFLALDALMELVNEK
jgi:3-dehydroquinate dehydratase II